jgi:hypothetical protein
LGNVVTALTYPGGKYKRIAITATAGNLNNDAVTPGLGKRYLIIEARITLVCDANASNRYINFVKFNATPVKIFSLGSSSVLVANETGMLQIGPIIYARGGSGGDTGTNDDYLGYTYPYMVNETDFIRISINGGLAGDSFSGYFDVLEL